MNPLRWICLQVFMLLLPVSIFAAVDAPRNFVVRFDILNYSGTVDDSVRSIFSDLLRPGDQLIVYSPSRVYGFSKETLARPRSELIAFLRKNLRNDANQAGRSYEQILRDMKVHVGKVEEVVMGLSPSGQEMEVGLKFALTGYRHQLENLQQLRRVNEALLQQMIGVFRNQAGDHHLVMVYEKEMRPVPNRQVMDKLRDMHKISFQALELFAQENTTPPFDVAAFAARCAQVPVKVHFFYMKPKNWDTMNADLFESSGDMFAAFSQVARSSGGLCSTVAEPAAALKALARHLAGEVSVEWSVKSDSSIP